MLRLLADENFNGDIVRGLLLRRPDLDIVRVQDVGLAALSDAAILSWAATNDRIVVTHDRATLPDEAHRRVADGESMAGVFLVNDRFAVGQAIQQILLIVECSDQQDWKQCVIHLPL